MALQTPALLELAQSARPRPAEMLGTSLPSGITIFTEFSYYSTKIGLVRFAGTGAPAGLFPKLTVGLPEIATEFAITVPLKLILVLP